jgi:hypothetical protein
MTKIFVCNQHKAGSQSIRQAFKILGLKLMGNKAQWEQSNRALAAGEIEYLLQDMEFDVFLHANMMPKLEHLDKHYPESRFIFLDRNIEDMITSALMHVLDNRFSDNDKRTWRDINTLAMREAYHNYHRRISKFRSDKNHRCLLMNICAGEGWNKLCKFLSMPVPKCKFPHKNDGLSKLLGLVKNATLAQCKLPSSISVDSDS